MHELAIAEQVARVAQEHAADRRVRRVRMRIGHLRQVVPASLEFGFALVTHGTPLEGATLEIASVPIAARCRPCDLESAQPDFPMRCPRCGGLALEVVRGEELQVESLELADEGEAEVADAGARAPEGHATAAR